MSFRKYGGLQFSSKNNYNNLINVTSSADLPQTIGAPNTTIDVLSSLTQSGLGLTIKQTDIASLNPNQLKRTDITGVASYGKIILRVIEHNTNQMIGLYPNSGDSAFNPIVRNGDNQIIALYEDGMIDTRDTQTLVVGTHQRQANGLKIIPPNGTTLGTTAIGQGITGGNTFTTSFSCDGLQSLIHGTGHFDSTTPPTSAQIIPSYNDSSTKIPTTEWVQTAIANSSGGGTGTSVFNNITVNGTATFNNGASSSNIQQTATNTLTIDNNFATSGNIVFRANNSLSAEQTILTLNGDTGLSTTNASLSGNLQIFNGANSSTLDMDGSNDFQINNNTINKRIIMNVLDGSGTNTNTATLGALQNTGFVVNSSIGYAMTATSTSTGVNSCGLFSTAYLNAFSGKSNASGFTNGRINLGVSGNGSYNLITSPNDAFVVGDNTAIDLGALTLTTHSSTRLGVRINSNSVNSVEVAGALIQLNATATGGLTSTTPMPLVSDSSNSIPTTAWVQSALSFVTSPYYFVRGYKFMTNPNYPLPLTSIGTININFTNGSTLKINDSINIRYSIRYDYNTTSSTAQSIYYKSYYGNLIIFPNRVIGNNGSVPCYLDGTINNSTSYTYSNATFAPYGRYIWAENYSHPYLIDPNNDNQQPIILTSVLQSQLSFQISMPYQTSGTPNSNCSLAVYLELINNNNSTLTYITSSGTSFFDSVQHTF